MYKRLLHWIIYFLKIHYIVLASIFLVTHYLHVKLIKCNFIKWILVHYKWHFINKCDDILDNSDYMI